MQLLEGDKEIITNLYETISHDKRHTKVKKIYFEPTSFRLFSRWNMNLVDLEVEKNTDLSKIRDIVRSIDDNGKVGGISAPVVILQEFRKMS